MIRKRFRDFCLLLSGLLLLLAGCSKKGAPVAASATPDTNVVAPASAPTSAATPPANAMPGQGPVPTTATARPITGTDPNSVLAQLTRELHRTMIGRKLSGSFDEFVAISHVQVPPPPAGKKYAIDKHWHVVLVNN